MTSFTPLRSAKGFQCPQYHSLRQCTHAHTQEDSNFSSTYTGLTNWLSFVFSTSPPFTTFLLNTFSLRSAVIIYYVFPYFPQSTQNSKTFMYLHLYLIIRIWVFIQSCGKSMYHRYISPNIYTLERNFCLYRSSHGKRSAYKDLHCSIAYDENTLEWAQKKLQSIQKMRGVYQIVYYLDM